MDVEKLKEDVIRAEGYAAGFQEGFRTCAKNIVDRESATAKPAAPELKVNE